MKLIDKLERKYGRFGIPNLTLYIVICYVIGYAINIINPAIMIYLNLEPYRILRGEIWRLVTWVLAPPAGENVFLFAIMVLFFYYPIGNSLERAWGTFRYTLYIFSGVLFTILGAFLLYFIMGRPLGIGGIFTTYYISMSIFLAFAVSCPDMKVLLWFVIPIKMSWMAVFYGIMILYDIVSYIRMGAWFMTVPIIASLLNFLIYFFSIRDMSRYNPKEIRRRQEFRRAMEPQGRVNPQTGAITKHKCAVCGRTELDDPNLEFRFCSKCSGNYEYCQDHLFTHKHIQ